MFCRKFGTMPSLANLCHYISHKIPCSLFSRFFFSLEGGVGLRKRARLENTVHATCQGWQNASSAGRLGCRGIGKMNSVQIFFVVNLRQKHFFSLFYALLLELFRRLFFSPGSIVNIFLFATFTTPPPPPPRDQMVSPLTLLFAARCLNNEQYHNAGSKLNQRK